GQPRRRGRQVHHVGRRRAQAVTPQSPHCACSPVARTTRSGFRLICVPGYDEPYGARLPDYIAARTSAAPHRGIVTETMATPNAAASASAPDGNGGTAARPVILTVDDDPGVSRAVARDLRRRYGDKWRIVRAESGPDALEALRQVKLRGDQAAILLADYRMP